MLAAYRIEAKLIGVTDFPPLQRTVRDVIASQTCFYGCQQNDMLTALIEITYDKIQLRINSLVVHPDYFRQGLASRLLKFVLTHYQYETALVETGLANLPAITLYEQFGFIETSRFNIAGGITKVAMRL